MNRRDLLDSMGTAVAYSLGDVVQVSAAESVPSVDDRDKVPIRALLPEGEALPEGYDAAMAIDQSRESLRGVRGDTKTTHYAQRTYTPGGETDGVDEVVECELHRLTDDAPDADLLARHHDEMVEEEFDTEDSPVEQFTDWVDANLDKSTVAGDRRTTYWRRLPILCNPTDRDLGERPCREYAFVVETCSWGTIKISARCEPATRGQARDLIDEVLPYVSRTVRTSPMPVSEAKLDRAERWAKMESDEREEVVSSAVRLLETTDEKEATPEALVEILDDFYGADETTTRRLLHRLVARGEVQRSTDATLSVT